MASKKAIELLDEFERHLKYDSGFWESHTADTPREKLLAYISDLEAVTTSLGKEVKDWMDLHRRIRKG